MGRRSRSPGAWPPARRPPAGPCGSAPGWPWPRWRCSSPGPASPSGWSAHHAPASTASTVPHGSRANLVILPLLCITLRCRLASSLDPCLGDVHKIAITRASWARHELLEISSSTEMMQICLAQTEAAVSRHTSGTRTQGTDPLHVLDYTVDESGIVVADLAQRPQRVCQLARPHAAACHVGAQQIEERFKVRVRLQHRQAHLRAHERAQHCCCSLQQTLRLGSKQPVDLGSKGVTERLACPGGVRAAHQAMQRSQAAVAHRNTLIAGHNTAQWLC